MSKNKIAIFDLDGTLISSENAIYQLLNESLVELGKLPLDFLIIRSLIGMNLIEMLRKTYPNEPADFYQSCSNLFHDKYQHASAKEQHILCYPHIKEQLEKLENAGWVMAVCTGAGRHSCEKHLQENAINSYFVTLKTSSDGYPSKPDTPILRAAIAECGGQPDEAIMIGDTVYDIRMATKMDVKSIGVLWGYHDKAQLLNAGADRLIDNPAQLFDSLEELAHE